MSKIKADSLSIFIETDKFIIRPNYKETLFKENDEVDVSHLQKNDYLVNNKEIWLVSSTLEEYSTMSPKTLLTRSNHFKLYDSSDVSLIDSKLSELNSEKEVEVELEEKMIYDISPNPLVVETEKVKVVKPKVVNPKVTKKTTKEVKEKKEEKPIKSSKTKK